MSAWAGPLIGTTGVAAAKSPGLPTDLAHLHTFGLAKPSSPIATRAAPPPSFATALRDVPTGPAHPVAAQTVAAQTVGQKFEAAVLTPLVAQMLPSKDNPVWGGQSGAIWRSLYAERLAETLAQSGGAGIAPLIDQMIGPDVKTGGAS